jgi:G6PDH family F420-dependent oxidoreductase
VSEIGVFLSSEEHGPSELVSFAQQAEAAGFRHLWISDHYHPWIDAQGHSPFVWCVLGGIAATTELEVTTAVTCPTIRIHPAILAQAAATAAMMMPGRFNFGVGSGENLNEHILGDRWPPTEVRLEMLEEAIEVMRKLWQGGIVSHEGKHYRVENARIYSLPKEPPPVLMSGFGPKAVRLAARVADGYIHVIPANELVDLYESCGGKGPKMAGVKVCWAEDESAARKLAFELWPTAGVPGELSQELPMPAHFQQAVENVTEEQVAEAIACGPDPERHVAAVKPYLEAGFDVVCISQVGKDQAGFLDFCRRELLPRLT